MKEIEHNGKIIKLNSDYRFLGEFVNGFCRVIVGEPLEHQIGYINEEGIEVIKPRFIMANDFSCGVAVVLISPSPDDYSKLTHSVINEKGEEIIDTSKQNYGRIWDFKDNMGIVRSRDGKLGYINKLGEEVIPTIYNRATQFSEGIAACKKFNDPYWVYFNQSGEELFRIKCRRAFEFSEGLAAVHEQTEKAYYINKQGKRVSPYFEHTFNFSKGLAAVKVNGKYGFINQNFDFVIMPKFDDCYCSDEYEFTKVFNEDGYAKVKMGDDIFYIDMEGKKVEKTKVLTKKNSSLFKIV